jgi:hypothetical protein
MEEDMPNFHIEGRMKGMKDIQVNFMFEISVPRISEIITDSNIIKDEEEFIIRAKTAAIPDRSNVPIESYFMGMKQIYQGRVEYGNSLTIDFEETEDQKIVKAIYVWQNVIFNTRDADTNSGHSLTNGKRLGSSGNQSVTGRTTDLFVKMYKYNGELCDNMIKVVNAWPSNISEVGLDMAGNEAIRYSVTFTYDYWNLMKA